MSTNLVGVSTTNIYLHKESLYNVMYTLEIRNSWHGRQFKITKVVDGNQTIFQRKQIWINGFCAKYIKDFNKKISNTAFPDKLTIIESENRCLAEYKDLSLLGWDLISLTVNLHVAGREPQKITTPTMIKIKGLKQHICKLNDLEKIAYKKSTLKRGITLLENPFSLNYYDLKDNLEIVFDPSPDEKQERGTREMELLFDKRKYLNFQGKLNEIWNLVFCIIDQKGNFGSGFLIGKNKILTNHHVVSSGTNFSIYFFYDDVFDEENPTFKIDIEDKNYYKLYDRSDHNLNRGKNELLDLAIITIPKTALSKVDKKLWKSLQKLACEFFKEPVINPKKGLTANIIQHPLREKKQIVFQSNELIKVGDNTLHYSTLTYKGTSGSPIISNEGKFLGYHFTECKKLIRRIQKIRELNINKNTFIPSYYKDIDDPQITWIIFADATCKRRTYNSPVDYKEDNVNLNEFIEKYNGPLDIGVETPEFFDKKFIEIHRKHRHCRCGIPATLLMQDNEVREILKANEKYLHKTRESEQPQPSATAPKDLENKKSSRNTLNISGKIVILGLAVVGVVTVVGIAAGAIGAHIYMRKNDRRS